MICDCCADLHGYYPELKGGDLLIIAGDLTRTDQEFEYFEFFDWVHAQDYKKKIVVAGNHDGELLKQFYCGPSNEEFVYLCDNGTEFEGLKIWGSPWTKRFPNMNPKCKAFTVHTEEELAEKWALIPDDVDILVTHSPPYGILDSINDVHVGSQSLLVLGFINLKLHVFGHIHEDYGQMDLGEMGIYVNASIMTEGYEPLNKPIRVVL